MKQVQTSEAVMQLPELPKDIACTGIHLHARKQLHMGNLHPSMVKPMVLAETLTSEYSTC